MISWPHFKVIKLLLAFSVRFNTALICVCVCVRQVVVSVVLELWNWIFDHYKNKMNLVEMYNFETFLN